ncbi:lysyl oxidase family protein [Streptomyces sp. CAU 1734]|uniref:lysyl oxidase family protein n=1 Tax=Streptomyces sp. CAU 1734 TaxID=3140360 RepID=UPI003260DD69
MIKKPVQRLWLPGIATASAIAVVAGVVAAAPASEAAPAPAPKSKLSLIAASKSVVVERDTDENGVPKSFELDLGTYVGVEGAPFEIRTTRKSYNDPLVAQQIIKDGKKTVTKTLPQGMVKDFSGLPGFVQVTLTDSAGRTALSRSESFCPNNASARISPGSPVHAKYPEGCPTNPFTLGSVWGIQNGWGTNTTHPDYQENVPATVGDGTYTAKISVAKKYRDAFGMADKPQTVKVIVRTLKPPAEGGERASAKGAHAGHGAGHSGHGAHGRAAGEESPVGLGLAHLKGHEVMTLQSPAVPHALTKTKGRTAAAALTGDGPGRTDGSRNMSALKPAAKRPAGRAVVPKGVPKPDLRTLPAWDIYTDTDPAGEGRAGDHLAFSSTTWNAGPAELIVDGFRKPGDELMKAYQYFYDTKGKQVGSAPAGTMEWDPREGHLHWHFTDFAAYRLLKADKKEVVRSDKEAFCLVNTDDVDFTVKNANWLTQKTSPTGECGQRSALSVRQALGVGNGDTYGGSLPGQSFDITTVPNGTYWIQVVANPSKKLHETDLKNNTSLRKVVLGGKPGARTVTVPQHGLVKSR